MLRLHNARGELWLLSRDTDRGEAWNNLYNHRSRNMKRLMLLGLLTVSVVSMSGCRWCGWGREGDVCNACPPPSAYPGDVYYGGEYTGEVYEGQVIEQGMPMMPVPENLPSPSGAR